MLHAVRTILCYVTDRSALGAGPDRIGTLAETIRRAIAAGLDWVQIREKDLPARALVALARGAVEAARGSGTKIVVNDRLDVALAVGAAGVHLGGESLAVRKVADWRAGRRTVEPREFLIGRSCHSLEEALEAERDAADYLFFGPVFATPSKEQYGPPQGTKRLEEVCRRVRIPVLAIGGVSAENVAECLRAGAAGIAAIRLFQQAADLGAVLAHLRTGTR